MNSGGSFMPPQPQPPKSNKMIIVMAVIVPMLCILSCVVGVILSGDDTPSPSSTPPSSTPSSTPPSSTPSSSPPSSTPSSSPPASSPPASSPPAASPPAASNLPTTTDGRCGTGSWGEVKCAGRSCCSHYKWCGGKQGEHSAWCSGTNRGAWNGKYDGTG